MARAKWGPSIGDADKWRFDVGDIVSMDYTGFSPECTPDGTMILDDHGRSAGGLSQVATCVVIARIPNPPDKVFALVFEDGSPAPPDPKCKCYVVRVIPESDIQAKNFFSHKLGRYYIVREKRVSQTNKEKRIAELGLWNHESGVFDRGRISELRNKVHSDEMNEKRGKSHAGDR